MNSMLGAATNPEEITLTLNAVIGLLGGSSALSVGLAVWIGRVWAKRIAQRDQAQLDTQLEAVRTELQKGMKLFEEKLAKERRADEDKHKVLSETMSMLGQLLVLERKIVMQYLNGCDDQLKGIAWRAYNDFLPELASYYIAHEVPYLKPYAIEFERIQAAINAVARECNDSKALGRPYSINFTEFEEAVKALQEKIAATDGVQ